MSADLNGAYMEDIVKHIKDTPEILLSALRRYEENPGEGFVFGFEHDETIRIFVLLQKALEAQARLLISYRIGRPPPEWVSKDIEKAREAGVKI